MVNEYDTIYDMTTRLYYNKWKQKRKFTCTFEKKTLNEAWRNSTSLVEVADWLEICKQSD